MSRLYNFFNLRWTDGYSHVSDAPAEVIVDLEAIMAQQPPAVSNATITTQRVRVGGHRDASLGILKLDVDVGGRRCSYNHVLVLASGYAPLPGERWLQIVRERYGTNVEIRIQALYEQLARLEKADGRHALEPLEIRAEDVASLIAADSSPASISSGRADAPPPSPESAPRSALRARVPAWTLAASIAVAAVFAVAWIMHRAGDPGCGEAGDDRAHREACIDLQAKLSAAEARIIDLEGENKLCLERKTGNVELDTCLGKQLECERTAKTLTTKVTRVEAAKNDVLQEKKAAEIRAAEALRAVDDARREAKDAQREAKDAQRKLEENIGKALKIVQNERAVAAADREKIAKDLEEARRLLQEASSQRDMQRNKLKEACKICGLSCALVCQR